MKEKNIESSEVSVHDSELDVDSISLPLLTELFDNFSEAVIVADSNRRMVYVNSTTEKLFGYVKTQLYGKETKMLYAVKSDFLEQGKKRFNVASKVVAESFRIAYCRADGHRFLGLTTGAAMRCKEGSVVGYIGIIRPSRTSDQSLNTLQKVHAITADVTLTYAQKIDSLLRVGLRHFNLDVAIQSIITGNEYKVESCVDYNNELEPSTIFNLTDTYCQHTIKEDKPVGFHFAGKSEIRHHPCYQNFKLESYIASPIKVDGKLYGTINFSGYSPTDPFCKDDYILMELLSDTLSYILYTKQTEEKIWQLARTDVLTGLANRRSTMDYLRKQIKLLSRTGSLLSILIIDIDHFKKINDQWGHSIGDEALVEFAHLASEFGRETDFVGRIGGEEFVFILPGADLEAGLEIGNKFRLRLLDKPIALGNGESITLKVSGGVAVLNDGETIESLLVRADKAMYQAKKGGRNRICVNEPGSAVP